MNLYTLKNGRWVTETRKYVEILGNYEIEKFEEFHVNVVTGEHCASEILSKLIGLDVYKDWGVGSRCTSEDVEKEFHIITKAYPEFLSINGDKCLMRDVMLGCVSKFNFEDIKYFCENPNLINRKQEFKDRSTKLGKKINFTLSWVVSPSTLGKIERHVEKNNTHITLELIKEKLSENTKGHKTRQRLVV